MKASTRLARIPRSNPAPEPNTSSLNARPSADRSISGGQADVIHSDAAVMKHSVTVGRDWQNPTTHSLLRDSVYLSRSKRTSPNLNV